MTEIVDGGYTWMLDDMFMALQPGTPIGWRVTVGVEPFGREYVMVSKCSCGEFAFRAGGYDAWEKACLLAGIHVKSFHLKSGRSAPVSDSATERPDGADATR